MYARRGNGCLSNPSNTPGYGGHVQDHLPREGLRFFSKTGGDGEVGPNKGEKFVVEPSAGGLGTFWWRWGDLNGDLAERGSGLMSGGTERGSRCWEEMNGLRVKVRMGLD